VNLSITRITNGEVVDGHPSIEGHKQIAKLIYTKIKSINKKRQTFIDGSPPR
jgi:hypothetical protein